MLAVGRWNQINVEKLMGSENSFRIRSGDYKILFEKRKTGLVIVRISVKHRKEIYR